MNQKKQNSIRINYTQTKVDSEFEEKIQKSISTIVEFAKKNDLNHKEYFLKEVFLYGTKSSFDDYIKLQPNWKAGVEVPTTYVGFGEKLKIHIVDFKTYKKIFPKLETTDYQKLITHELAHLFHIQYLNGEEDKMGPEWFYEGFACLVASQFSGAELPPKEQIQKILEGSKSGNYKYYSAIVQRLSKKKNIKELLEFATKSSFFEIATDLLINT